MGIMGKKIITENSADYYFQNLRPGSCLNEAIRKVLYNKQAHKDVVLLMHMILDDLGRTDKNRLPLLPIINDCGFAIQQASYDDKVTGILCTGNIIHKIFHPEEDCKKLIVLNMHSQSVWDDAKTRLVTTQLFAHYLLTATEENYEEFGCALMQNGDICEIPEYLYETEIIDEDMDKDMDEDMDQSEVSEEQDYTPPDYDSESKEEEIEEIEENEIIFSPEPS